MSSPDVFVAANHVSTDIDSSFELGVNVRIGRGWALDVAARYVTADAAGDNQYNGYIVNGGLLWQF